MGRMGGVLHNTIGFAGASCKENFQNGGERDTDDFCSCVHCALEGLVVCYTTVPVPDRDTAGQHTLNGSPVEGGEDGVENSVLLKCRKLRREDQETSDWVVSRILYSMTCHWYLWSSKSQS